MEREKRVARIREGIAAAKAAGMPIGGDRGQFAEIAHLGREKSASVRAAKADQRARELGPLVSAWREAGWTLQEIADELTRREIPTGRGGPWSPH